MRTLQALLIVSVALAGVSACGGVPPPPLDNAESGIRAARELGADSDPQGKLHLSLAQEEFDNAKKLETSGDNERARYVLSKAEADADLALAEAREAQAHAKAQQVKDQITMIKNVQK